MSAPAGSYIVRHERVLPPTAEDVRVGESRRTHEQVSRWAYATLEEARSAICGLIRERQAWVPEVKLAYSRLAASGGTITLPDGSEIVVEATTWPHIAEQVNSGKQRKIRVGELTATDWLAAWNAEHGIPGQEATER